MTLSHDSVIQACYIVSAVLFIFGLKMLSRPQSARHGNAVSAAGMLLAIVATLLVGGLSFTWILVGMLIGTAIGVVASYAVPMTAMPEMVALYNGLGGLASMLVGWAEYHTQPDGTLFRNTAVGMDEIHVLFPRKAGKEGVIRLREPHSVPAHVGNLHSRFLREPAHGPGNKAEPPVRAVFLA